MLEDLITINAKSGRVTKELISSIKQAMDKINEVTLSVYKRLTVVETRVSEIEGMNLILKGLASDTSE